LKNILTKTVFIIFDLLFLNFIFFISKHICACEGDNFHIGFNLIIIFLFYYEGIYNFRYDFWQEIKKIFKGLFFSFLIFVSILSFIKGNSFFILVYFALLFLSFPIYRRILKRIIFKFSFFKEKVKIFDKSGSIQNEIKNNWYLGMLNTDNDFDIVLINSRDFNLQNLNEIVEKYLYNKKIYLIPYLNEINFSNSEIFEYHNVRTNIINLENKLLKKSNVFFKYFSDIVLSLLLLPIFVIIHLIVSFLIKIDSKGSVFFKQTRVAKDEKPFVCYKYRTMYENGEDILKQYLKNHPEEIEYYEKYHKYQNDPRITKIGKFLRETSLDELPQIINILKGEMSFIGPRPYMFEEIENIKDIHIILKVKPGITGLWQVSGRNNLTFKERLEVDNWYIKNWSLWEDFIILVKTLKVVFLKVGAR